jgi:hypothetical protein
MAVKVDETRADYLAPRLNYAVILGQRPRFLDAQPGDFAIRDK